MLRLGAESTVPMRGSKGSALAYAEQGAVMVGLGCVQGSRGDQCETGETGKEGSEEIHK
jgi:hypothetical protein